MLCILNETNADLYFKWNEYDTINSDENAISLYIISACQI